MSTESDPVVEMCCPRCGWEFFALPTEEFIFCPECGEEIEGALEEEKGEHES